MNLTAQFMKKALMALNRQLEKAKQTSPVRLIIGGGGAMILGHHFPLSTTDIDGIPRMGMSIEELDPFIKKVARELNIPSDWLNSYYVTFTHVLPKDYDTRLKLIFTFSHLIVEALSKDDLLIMKCFAGRIKDQPHARALIRSGAQIAFVEKHIERLKTKRIPGAQEALDFLDEMNDTV